MLLEQASHLLECLEINAPLAPARQLFTHQFYRVVFPCREKLPCRSLTRFSAGDFEQIATARECDFKFNVPRMRDERAHGRTPISLQLDLYPSLRRIFEFD